MNSRKLKVETTVGKTKHYEGVRFLCESQSVAKKLQDAYLKKGAEYERVVTALCDSGKAEFIG